MVVKCPPRACVRERLVSTLLPYKQSCADNKLVRATEYIALKHALPSTARSAIGFKVFTTLDERLCICAYMFPDT
jgi:hypothetical protein